MVRCWACSDALRSLMSRAIFEAPMITPLALQMGEIVSATSMRRPLLATRTVSK